MSHQLITDMLREAQPDAPDVLFYFSFADGNRPKGEQFLGGLYIFGKSMTGALRRSHEQKLNPGGEVLMFEMPPDLMERIDPKWIGRLLTRAELEDMDRDQRARNA